MQRNERQRRGEKGQTILLVAISLISLLAMAALAIDVVTLYVARSEIQRAADAAALAGAKAIADSAVTTLPSGDTNCNDALTLAQNLAGDAITKVLPYNLVAGTAPSQYGPSPSFINLTGCPASNPQVTVALEQTGVPTLFARIWSRTAVSVKASATAEVYNAANTQSFTPVSLTNVKPWLVANLDPTQGGPPPTFVFVNETTGVVEQNAGSPTGSVIGETFDLKFVPCSGGCTLTAIPPSVEVQYVAAVAPSSYTQDVCSSTVLSSPSCSAPDCTNYEYAIACADANSYAYLYCGGATAPNQLQDTTITDGGLTGASAADTLLLIHATSAGGGQGQDTLDLNGWPDNPVEVTAGGGWTAWTGAGLSGRHVSTSSSIVTVPIIDKTVSPTQSVNVVGFLQGFINCVEDTTHNCGNPGGPPNKDPGDINITVLNVVGCSNSPNSNTPVVGGNGASALPVRLIQ